MKKKAVWKATLSNNTDFPQGTEFTTLKELREFLRTYYIGEAGNLYSESWSVEGDYPEGIFELLEPPISDGRSWSRR